MKFLPDLDKVSLDDIEIIGQLPNLKTIPEVDYFVYRNYNKLEKGVFPLPGGVKVWSAGEYQGVPLMLGTFDKYLWIIADTSQNRTSLMRYNYDDKEGTYVLDPLLYSRQLIVERSINAMSLRELAQQATATRFTGEPNLGDSMSSAATTTVEQMSVNDGITGGNNIRLVRDAMANSYIVGYIMGTGPALSLKMQTKKKKGTTASYYIQAVESKPGRLLQVCMSIPARCCSRGGQLADPSEIMAGNIDSNVAREDNYKLCLTKQTAVGYIGVLGEKMPEFAPFVSNVKTQWTPTQILGGSQEVSFVRLGYTANPHYAPNSGSTPRATSRKGSKDPFKFSLKSTRGSLYTKNNVMWLRAQEHYKIPDGKLTEEEAARLNDIAFGSWEYRQRKQDSASSEKISTLQAAFINCPRQIWRKTVTDAEGKTHDVIGSSFFMAAETEKLPSGEEIPNERNSLTYVPWDVPAKEAETKSVPVTRIVDRHRVTNPDTGKTRMMGTTVKWAEFPDHELFAPCNNFVKYIISNGYTTKQQLSNMVLRTTRTKASEGLSPDVLFCLKSFITSQSFQEDIRTVQTRLADSAIIRGE